MDRKSLTRWLLMLPLIVLLLTACAGTSTNSLGNSQLVKPATIPVLPMQAKQLPAPPWCLPTCLSALTKERESWQKLLTKPDSEGRRVR